MNNLELIRIDNLLTHDFNLNIDPKLDEKTKYLIKSYTNTYYGTLSQYLLGEIEGNDMLDEMAQKLTSTIKLCSLPEPLTVYRGTSVLIFDGKNPRNYIKKNKEVTMKNFLSTSLAKSEAFNFTKKVAKNPGIMLEIELPKGYPALWVKPLSFHKLEQEVLLMPSITFDILDYNEHCNEQGYEYTRIHTKVKS